MEEQSHTETYGERAPQFMIELVADGAPGGGLKLLLWDGTQQHIGTTLRQEGGPGSEFTVRMFTAPELDSTIRRAVHFPTHAAPYESARELLDGVRTLVEKYTPLHEKLASLAAYSVLASWLVDCLETPICLSIFGSESTEKRQLFRLLGCLYRRALLLSEMSLSGVYSLPMNLRPALFIEGREPNQDLQKLLRASGARDTFVPRNGRLVNLGCAKVICSEDPLYDAAVGSFIEIPVTPSSEPLPILDQRTQQKIVDEFQPKLLMFRLKTYQQAANSDFDVPKFVSPVRELARSLGACVALEPELQAEIVPLLHAQNQQALSEGSISLYAVVVEALLLLCHEGKKGSVHVQTIAARVNKILEQRGEMFEMRPKPVGTKVKILGIPTQRLDAAGRGILLLNGVRQRIHKLALDYQVPGARSGPCSCSNCRELGLTQRDDVDVDAQSQEEIDKIL